MNVHGSCSDEVSARQDAQRSDLSRGVLRLQRLSDGAINNFLLQVNDLHNLQMRCEEGKVY